MKVYIVIALSGDEIDEIAAIFLSHASAIDYLNTFVGDGYELKTRRAGETYCYSEELVYETWKDAINFFGKAEIYIHSWQILEFEAKD